MRRGVGLRGVLDVGADQDQAAGAAFAVGGGDAGLGAADLAGEGIALAALGLLERLIYRKFKNSFPGALRPESGMVGRFF